MAASKWQNFTLEELQCRCDCGLGAGNMKPDVMHALELMRLGLGFELPITSAVRCADYNSKVSYTGRHGVHTLGVAVDIDTRQMTAQQKLMLMRMAELFGVTGIGVGKQFIHLDWWQDSAKRPALWGY